MYHVGRLDASLRLVRAVLDKMSAGNSANSLSAYLAGVQSSQGVDVVDDIISTFKDDAEHSWAVILTIWRCGANDTRVQWLTELMQSGTLSADMLHPLEHMNWSEVKPPILQAFMESLLEQQNATGDTIALNIAVAERNRLSDERDLLEDVFLRASRGPKKGTMDAFYWERASEVLLEEGRIDVVIRGAAGVVSTTDRYAGDQEAWKLLGELAERHAAEIWAALTPVLDKRDERAFSVVMGFRSNRLLRRLPVHVVLDWIGSNEERAFWVAMMCNVQSSELDEIVRQLLIRFGPDGDAASELAARAGSTDGVVSSIAGHAKQQVDNARRWARDGDANVAEWGRRMVEQLEQSHEYHSAWEEFRDRQYE